MKTAHDNKALTIVATQLAEIQAAAERQNRPADDVLRDVIAQGLSEYRKAQALGLADHDPPLTEVYRKVLRDAIAEGVGSARAGRLVDGECVFARIEAEMVELEQQEHV